jgi:hypothetical protein
MFISIFDMNKVFLQFFFFFTRVIYEVMYSSITLDMHWQTSTRFFKETGTIQSLWEWTIFGIFKLLELYYIGKEYGRWLSRKQFSRSSIFWPETARENEKEKTTYRATGLHAISYE